MANYRHYKYILFVAMLLSKSIIAQDDTLVEGKEYKIYKCFPTERVVDMKCNKHPYLHNELRDVLKKERKLKYFFSKSEFAKFMKSYELVTEILERNDDFKYQPFYVFEYDLHGLLINEGVAYCNGDNFIPTGNFIKYFPNQKKEYQISYIKRKSINDTYEKNGTWVYFNKNGDTTNLQKWDYGKYVSEWPQKDTNRIMGLNVYCKNKLLERYDTIDVDEIRFLKVKPIFRNKSKILENTYQGLQLRKNEAEAFFYFSESLIDISKYNFKNLVRIVNESGLSSYNYIALSVYVHNNTYDSNYDFYIIIRN